MTTKAIIGAFALLLSAALPVAAQQKSGRWTVYPSRGEHFSNIIETPHKTYLHSGSGLFSLSDDDQESYSYNSYNKLSDRAAIHMIRYNPDGEYLFVAYDNGNIDLIYDNGKVANMAEIKDAVINTGRNINDVAFNDGKIYVATDFGMVVYDDSRHLVVESGIYNKAIDHVFVMGDNLVLASSPDIYVAPLAGKHAQLDKFTPVNKLYYTGLAKVNDNTLAYLHTSKAVYLCTYDFGAGTAAAKAAGITGVGKLYPLADGLYALEAGNIAIVGNDGSVSRTPRPEAYPADELFFNTTASVWVNNTDGLVRFDLSKGTPVLLMQPWLPEAVTTTQPVQMAWSADGDRLYLSNRCYTFYLNTDAGGGIHETFARTSAIHRDGSITDEQPFDIPYPTTSVDWNRVSGNGATSRMIGGPGFMATDPDDPEMYYFANKVGGIFVVKDGKYYHLINSSNTPARKATWTEDFISVSFDGYGNLWILTGIDKTDRQNTFMLPAAKRRNIKNATAADWQAPAVSPQFKVSHDAKAFFFPGLNYALFATGGWATGIMMHYDNKTPGDTSDDRFQFHTELRDQNANILNMSFFIDAVADHNGHIWVGTGQGLFVIENPAKMMESGTATVHRPIVARNDGTGLGDYLLETEQINKITVDPANRKWLATNTSGAYLVSADGREILAHYTTDNSALPSNTVYSIACDPNSNKVYFGTDGGVVAYDSDSSPAADDYSEVYAYPNPVRPEYTGWITIAGLMDNSLVKIADSAGNVIHQTRSEGGMVSWDGCDSAGRRVRTGVYYVFASQNTDGASGAVAKILVVN